MTGEEIAARAISQLERRLSDSNEKLILQREINRLMRNMIAEAMDRIDAGRTGEAHSTLRLAIGPDRNLNPRLRRT